MFTRNTDPTNWRIDRLWKPGDSLNLAIGQGNLLVTPLQMTRLYAAIANGGKLVTPRLMDVEPERDDRAHRSPARAQAGAGLDQQPEGRQARLFERAGPSGLSYGVFGNFPVPSRQTGTAQKAIDRGTGVRRTSRGGAVMVRRTTRRSSSAP
jgi:membrane carboxypeptidase/penicillin-binding protein